jgi:hypothetical protein
MLWNLAENIKILPNKHLGHSVFPYIANILVCTINVGQNIWWT